MWNLKLKPVSRIYKVKLEQILIFLSLLSSYSLKSFSFNLLIYKVQFLKSLPLIYTKNTYHTFKNKIFFNEDWNKKVNLLITKPKLQIQKYKKLFLTYNYINMFLHSKANVPHSSFVSLYIFNHHSNLGYLNFKKTFNIWINLINFINQVFYYNIKFSFFSSNYFKYESLALNWTNKKYLSKLWKYNYPFIFFLNNKTTLDNDIFFYKLSKNISNIAFVVDIFYHKKTIFYLNKYRFITVGPVPISSSLYSLTFSLPSSANSVFSNLFFLRLILKLRKIICRKKFLEYDQFNC